MIQSIQRKPKTCLCHDKIYLYNALSKLHIVGGWRGIACTYATKDISEQYHMEGEAIKHS